MAKADPRTVDMTMMYALHAAFRRDLQLLAQHASRRMRDPANRHRTWAGWELFKEQIEHHHTGEDTGLWPRMRVNLTDRQDALDVLQDMENEHAIIEPAVQAVDHAFGSGSYDQVADALDDLSTKTVNHFAHEERDVVPLANETLDPRALNAFSREQAKQVGFRGAGQFFSWLLEDATPQHTQAVLGSLPPPLRLAYRRVWSPRFAKSDRWA